MDTPHPPKKNLAELAKTPGKVVHTAAPKAARLLDSVDPELKAAPPPAPDAQPVPKNMRSAFGPVAMPGTYDVEPEIAGPARAARHAPPAETKPCPGCGWPLSLATSAVCTRCGFSRATGQAVATATGQVEAPAPLPDTRFQTYMHDAATSGKAWLEAGIVLSVGLLLGVVANAIVGIHGREGLDASGVYLGCYAVTLPLVLGVYLAACLVLVDYVGPLPLLALRLAAALALADGVQYMCDLPTLWGFSFTPLCAAIGFALALLIFMGYLYKWLDMEITDAIVITGAVYIGKLLLNVLVFRGMFGSGPPTV